MSLRITADRDLCMSAGLCALEAAEAFALDDDESVVVLDGAAEADPERVRAAADRCPSMAITVERTSP